MKKLLSIIIVTIFVLSGCSNTVTQEDLLSAGFTYESDSYDSIYIFTSPDDEYSLAVGSVDDMEGYLGVAAQTPEDQFGDGEFEFYIPYSYLGTDITSPEQEAYYSFINIDGMELGKAAEWGYSAMNNSFSESDYKDQWEVFQQFIVENFKDEDALQNQFNFNQEV